MRIKGASFRGGGVLAPGTSAVRFQLSGHLLLLASAVYMLQILAFLAVKR
jgi:hypothetical protein